MGRTGLLKQNRNETEMKCGLIGRTLGHSFSPEIHNRLERYEYGLIELEPDEVGPFLTSGAFDGLNVTIPYKQTVIPFLDDMTDLAREVGVVNTIANRGGKLVGHNTDIGGMKMLIEKLGLNLTGKTVLIAGSGGTSKTAEYVAADLGAFEILRVSRTGKDGAITYEQAYSDYSHAQILINTTPVGMYPNTDGVPFDLGAFCQAEGVVDAVYNPLTTNFVRQARAKGIPAENGLYMLVAQAMLAAAFFTQEPVDRETTDRIYHEILREKRSIVLTGMPGSGKSTLGRILAERLGRELVETDNEIVREAGMPITDIFAKYGEPYFRDLESEIIRKASSTGGKVISTGGGAVLRKENVEALSMNGKIVFLDRPLEDLLPTDDRPLANDADKIKALYKKRYPIYTEAADVVLKVEGTEEHMADMIWRAVL